MKVFIAGATGVLGRRLCREFHARKHTVLGLARSAKNEATIRELGGECRTADLFDADSLARAARGAEVLVHAATAIPTAMKPAPQDWILNDRIRREGTRALVEAAKRVGAQMLVIQSITWVARPTDQAAFDEDSPLNPDATIQSAADMETIAREAGERYGLRVAILRCGWFYAADTAHTRVFGQQLAGRKLPIIGKGDAMWSWIHVDDAASAFVLAAEAGKSGLWHIVDNEPVRSGVYLRAFAERIGAAEPRHVPVWLARLIAGSFAVNFMAGSTKTSNARFRRDFDWSLRYPSYHEGLDEVIAEWRAENFLDLGNNRAA